MDDSKNSQDIDFTVDVDNLYREEAISDLKVASIRRLVPINPDGTDDASRSPIFIGHSQLMSPEGPLPIQGRLEANNLKEACDVFPDTMQKALQEMIARIQEMQRQEQAQKNDASRIIVPGR